MLNVKQCDHDCVLLAKFYSKCISMSFEQLKCILECVALIIKFIEQYIVENISMPMYILGRILCLDCIKCDSGGVGLGPHCQVICAWNVG